MSRFLVFMSNSRACKGNTKVLSKRIQSLANRNKSQRAVRVVVGGAYKR